MKISVIIPVYNVEKYLKRCVDSILFQKNVQLFEENIEVLLINDGSPDNSQELIDGYVNQYNFIKGFIKPNGGLADTRNYGLAKAMGDYVWFIDSDDWIADDSFAFLFSELKNEDIEVLEFDYSMKKDFKEKELSLDPYYSTIATDIITGKEIIGKYGYSISVTNKIFKREKLIEENFFFPKGRLSEDNIPLLNLLLKVNFYRKKQKCLYYYFIRQDSITQSKNVEHLKKYCKDIILNINEMSQLVSKEDEKISKKIKEMQYFLFFNVLSIVVRNIKDIEFYNFVIDEGKRLSIYPLEYYNYHNSLKRHLFSLFVLNSEKISKMLIKL